ncbi:hypothetical protein HCEG_03967 [Histoplasma capsulatum var. duboisii H88]|uniref:Uncharacterized protein n=1 Tax=Ajellomyces capsulatus (strain H88) TaxID=544711 RepID=F0UEM2_AJEC8|nr:hypothetical protein HCEG_03967 [Histoplasma capsulatum var. duboisii H88]
MSTSTTFHVLGPLFRVPYIGRSRLVGGRAEASRSREARKVGVGEETERFFFQRESYTANQIGTGVKRGAFR